MKIGVMQSCYENGKEETINFYIKTTDDYISNWFLLCSESKRVQ